MQSMSVFSCYSFLFFNFLLCQAKIQKRYFGIYKKGCTLLTAFIFFNRKENEAKENFSPHSSSCISTLLMIKTFRCLSSQTRLLWQAQTRRARLRNASRNTTELSLMGKRLLSRGGAPP